MQNGQFLTSSHKEYPPVFGKALAWALGDGIVQNLKIRGARVATDLPPDSLRWLVEAAEISSVVVMGRHLLARLPRPMSHFVSRAFPLR